MNSAPQHALRQQLGGEALAQWLPQSQQTQGHQSGCACTLCRSKTTPATEDELRTMAQQLKEDRELRATDLIRVVIAERDTACFERDKGKAIIAALRDEAMRVSQRSNHLADEAQRLADENRDLLVENAKLRRELETMARKVRK